MEDWGLDDWPGRNVKSLKFVVQRGQVNAKHLCSLGLMPARPLESRLDQMCFESAKFVRQADASAQIYRSERGIGLDLLNKLKGDVFQ